jgi:rhomboid protease GluP
MRSSSRRSATSDSSSPNSFDAPDSLAAPVIVFRSVRRRDCDERAFVLTAVGIANDVAVDEQGFVVLVESVVSAQARHHLWQYEHERQRRPPPEIPFKLQPQAWRGSLVYVLLLLALPLAVASGWFVLNPYDIGVMDPGRIREGEWWRAITALTLHWDAAHLVGNLGSGALLGYSAAQIWGSARAWLLVLLAAVTANLVEGFGGAAGYVSAGASTAVFAALGLVTAHTWRTHRWRAQGTLRQAAPLVAGLVLLGMFGSGDPQEQGASPTNVLSHALGFMAGLGWGAAFAAQRGEALLNRVPPWLATVLTTGTVLGAWAVALWAAV